MPDVFRHCGARAVDRARADAIEAAVSVARQRAEKSIKPSSRGCFGGSCR